MKKKIRKLVLGLILFIMLCVSCVIVGYFYFLEAPSKNSDKVTVYIEQGSTYSTIGSILEDNGIIRNELAYKIYLKLNPVSEEVPLEYGDYILDKNNSVPETIEVLKKGSISLADTVSVTFVEGKNMRYYASKISENFNISEDEIFDKLSDEKYLDKLINDYWFLTDEIKDPGIYYSLEGYLYPDTYEFYSSASIDDIFRKMLDNFDKKITPYKESIESSKYSLHELVTLASIIELEAGGADRASVSGVFYNRLNKGMSLGSDVTGYYGAKMDDWSNGLGEHVNDCNHYNTRGSCVKALPIGAICNPSVKSIDAAINPKSHKYYYFVADCSGKTYLTKTYNEHLNTISKLKREGNWCDN